MIEQLWFTLWHNPTVKQDCHLSEAKDLDKKHGQLETARVFS